MTRRIGVLLIVIATLGGYLMVVNAETYVPTGDPVMTLRMSTFRTFYSGDPRSRAQFESEYCGEPVPAPDQDQVAVDPFDRFRPLAVRQECLAANERLITFGVGTRKLVGSVTLGNALIAPAALAMTGAFLVFRPRKPPKP